ncbi:response regulator transcription factor [Microbacterium sp. LWO13-1.2]|uniref:response regulator transcription factor n=1 Tax=Microbacterium sp. LWO13-1.2 TaxID=3135262 RepID=UPI003139A708
MSIRVVVADDQELVRTGFVMILDAQPDIDVVGEASDGLQAIAAAHVHRPDVMLMDIRMPQLDGIAATKAICAATPTRVIMLTTFDQDDYVFDALRSGASGYLLKDLRRDDLVQAVRVVAAGDALIAPSVTRRLIEAVVQGRPLPDIPVRYRDVLTARELEILVLLGRARSNAEMAAELVVSEHTVKTHVSNVLTKLHLRDRAQAAISAYEMGLIVPGSAGDVPSAGAFERPS